MKLNPPNTTLPRHLLLALVAFSIPIGMQAQQPAAQPEEDVFVMPEFIVVGETQGYLASTSNSGTRLNQIIKELPIPVEIVTRDFIEDTGALTVTEALQFTSGVETVITAQQPGENPQQNSFRMRGFVSQAVLRNGFRREGSTDTINVAQVDVVRGPNALLYGIGNFGGVVNYVTRDPVDDFRYSTQVSVGSWDFYRATIDVTGPIITDLAFRLPMFYQTRGNWYDNYDQEKWGIAPVLVYKIGKTTRFALESEYFYTKTSDPENPLNPNLRRPDYYNFIDTTYHPGSDGFLIYPNEEFRYSGKDVFLRQEDFGILGTVAHSFSDTLGFNGGAYWSSTRRIGQSMSMNLSQIDDILNPTSIIGRRNRALYPWAYLPQHELYNDWRAEDYHALQYNWGKSDSERTRMQIRGEFLWKPTFLGLEHSFLAGTTYDKMENETKGFIFADTNRPILNVGVQPYPTYTGAYSRFQSIYDYSPIRFNPSESEMFFETRDSTRGFIAWSRGTYLIHQTSFWNDKIKTISGIRWDRYQIGRENVYSAAESRLATSPDPVNLPEAGNLSLVGTRKPVAHQNEAEEFNYSFGLSFTPTEAITMFVLTASALDPETTGGQRGPTGFVPDPQLGQSYEFGVKVDLFKRKISASMSVYQIDRENVAVPSSHPARNLRTDETIIPPTGISDPDNPSYSQLWVDQGRDAPGSLSLREDQSKGFDSQIFLINLIPGFETIIGFSYNKYKIKDHRYWIYNEVRNDAGELTDFQFTQVSALAYRDETTTPVPWLESRLNNDTPKYTFRLWTKYTFHEGPLEGFDVGLGVSWSDRREATFGFEDNSSYKIIPDKTTVNMAFGYKKKFNNFDMNLRINVDNLLDDDKVYGYSYTTPRNYRLTASFNF